MGFFTFALGTLFARHASSRPSSAPGFIFFAHFLAGREGLSYKEAFAETTPEVALDDVLEQTEVIAGILARKLVNYHRAWACILLEVMLFLIVVLIGRVS